MFDDDEGAPVRPLQSMAEPVPPSSSSAFPTAYEHRWRTPSAIVAAVADVCGPILLDPCASAHPGYWFARWNLTDHRLAEPLSEAAIGGELGDGLTADWRLLAHAGRLPGDTRPGCVFVNSPWGRDLIGRWVEKCCEEASRRALTIVGLWPLTGGAWLTSVMRSMYRPDLVVLPGRPRFRMPDEDRAQGAGRYPCGLTIWQPWGRGVFAQQLAERLGGWAA